MPGKRRDIESFGIGNRSDIQEILTNARAGQGSGCPEGYVRNPENAIRDAALVAWEYISNKRVSEFTGRKYHDDVYVGLTMDKWRLNKVGEKGVLQFYIRILKRGRRHKICSKCKTKNGAESKFCRTCGLPLAEIPFDYHLKEVWKWKDIRLDDPFTKYILDWLLYLQQRNYQGRVFAISRQHAWRIMNNLGITNHLNRHRRATHLSSKMNAFELKEALDRATIPVEYVHGEPTLQLAKTEEADKEWE